MSSSDHKFQATKRNFIKFSLYAGSAALTTGLYRYFRGNPDLARELTPENIYDERGSIMKSSIYDLSNESNSLVKELTPFQSITHYNNFYEFSTDKQAVAARSAAWKIKDWQLQIEGLVEKPQTFSLEQIQKIETEDRIYRFRCVEGWSMVVPWRGFSLAKVIELAKPLSGANYVAFESFFDEAAMPSARFAGIPFPYIEGLRLDEALHPLTFLATGLYQKPLPNQNGAPLRLIVPWKYGFKSIKSIAKIRLVENEPPTTWSLANNSEYGFYSNVNPSVDHPRWSQKTERRIGELKLRDTLMFNGYEKEVAHLYRDMDLRKHF